jgi:hypothetical protein
MNTTEQISKREIKYHDLLIKNDNLKKDILSILDSETDLSKLNLIHEDKYINGITADFTCVYDDEIKAIIEVKAADIGVTDYVRGIGQVLQYEYFFDNNISPKGWKYTTDFKSILLIPSDVIKLNSFNIGKFKYPNTTLIVEINENSNVARRISVKELQELSTVNEDNLTSICQYYIRDNRLFEIYMLLRYLTLLKIKGETYCKRTDIEAELKKTKTINNGNWRNAWISVSSLGFINSSNLPTASGIQIGLLEYAEFAYLMYASYIKPFVDVIMDYFNENECNLSKNYREIINDLKTKFNNRDILFLTQSNGRYLSSWLNILRDDYGCIDFKSRNNNRKIIYTPSNLNKDTFIKKINSNTNSKDYICRLKEITG